MKTVWKFQIAARAGMHEVKMPEGAKVLSALKQYEDVSIISIWALVDPEAQICSRIIYVAETGARIVMDGWNYRFIATIKIAEDYILHLFERI